MRTVARILSALLALFFLGTGLTYIFNPDAVLSAASITPDSIAGYAYVRSNIGGPFLTLGIFVAIAAIQARKEALLPIMVFVPIAIIARILSLIVDGSAPIVIRLLVVMSVLLVLTVSSYVMFQRSETASS